MILLAIWNPSLSPGKGPVDLMLVLDESNSISIEHNNSVWKSFIKTSQSLPEKSRVSLLRFADRARIELPWTSGDFHELKKNIDHMAIVLNEEEKLQGLITIEDLIEEIVGDIVGESDR